MSETPSRYVCPISQELMVDPVMDRCGHNFERSAIKTWLSQNSTCPLGREPLDVDALYCNLVLREEISEWKSRTATSSGTRTESSISVSSNSSIGGFRENSWRPVLQGNAHEKPTPPSIPKTYYNSHPSADSSTPTIPRSYSQSTHNSAPNAEAGIFSAPTEPISYNQSSFTRSNPSPSAEAELLFLQRLAEGGDIVSQFKLAQRYEGGIGVKQDWYVSAAWYAQAAELGHAEAQWCLGRCCENGNGVMKSKETALLWYQKAADQGFDPAVEAARRLKPQETELELVQRLALEGDANAQFQLGYRYEVGLDVACSKEQAMVWYRVSANKGNSLSKDAVRRLEAAGGTLSPTKSETEVDRLLRLAEKGDVTSQFKLGQRYEVKQDWYQSVAWYSRAAEKGHAESQWCLGRCYEEGRGVPKAKEVAITWFQKAADGGFALAEDALRRLRPETELQRVQRLAAQGDANAQFQLGYRYETGLDVACSKDQAMRWYGAAAKQGNSLSREALRRRIY